MIHDPRDNPNQDSSVTHPPHDTEGDVEDAHVRRSTNEDGGNLDDDIHLLQQQVTQRTLQNQLNELQNQGRGRNQQGAATQAAPAVSPQPKQQAKQQVNQAETPIKESPWPMLLIGGGLVIIALLYLAQDIFLPIFNKLFGIE